MRRRRDFAVRLLLGGFAAGGVIASHLVAYLAAAPDRHERQALLEHSGHANWDWVLALAMGVLVLSLVRFATARIWNPVPIEESPADLYRYAIPRLAALQLICFTALEMGERSLVGDSLVHLAAEPAFLIGIGLQLVFAGLGACLLVLWARTIERVVSICLGFLADQARVVSVWWDAFLLHGSQTVVGAGHPRAPPSSS